MRIRSFAFFAAVAVSCVLPGSALFGQTLRLYGMSEGAVNLAGKPGANPQVPAPTLIMDQAGWAVFTARIPATLPNPEVMGGDPVTNYDTYKEMQPDFHTRCYAVIYQDASRNGPLRLESADLVGTTLRLRASVLKRGPEARPRDLGFYTLYEFPKLRSMDGKLDYAASEIDPGPARSIVQDETTGLYGIKGPDGKWIAGPAWSYTFGVDAWDNCVVSAKNGLILVDRNGKELVRPLVFDNGPDYFCEGLARYMDKSKKVGYYGLDGKIVIPAQWDFAEPFTGGKALVVKGGKEVRSGEHASWSGGQRNFIDDTGKLSGAWNGSE